jgi:PhnB protein
MALTTTTHLNFAGDARQALEFYGGVFGGHVVIATYGDFGAPAGTPDVDAVVWGQVTTDSGFRVMAYDVPTAGRTGTRATPGSTRREHGTTLTEDSFFLSLRGDTVEEVTALWEALAEGATIVEPLAEAAFAPVFGMLTDRFGVTWIVDVAAVHQA